MEHRRCATWWQVFLVLVRRLPTRPFSGFSCLSNFYFRTSILFTSSATRGSVVFMCWAFISFLGGFVTPTFAQVMLNLAATIGSNVKYPREEFRKAAEFLVPFTVWNGIMCATAGLYLIILSLYGIQYSPIPSGFSPRTVMVFTNEARIASWVAISATSLGALVLLVPNVILIVYNFSNL